MWTKTKVAKASFSGQNNQTNHLACAVRKKRLKVSIDDETYLSPRDLWVSPVSLRRVLAIGSCLLRSWPRVIENSRPGCPCDFFLFNNVNQLPTLPPHHPTEYDFQIVQIPLRSVLPDRSYFRLRFDDIDAYEKLLSQCIERMTHALAGAMRWNVEHGILAFNFNFLVPQVNPIGRLLPRYDLRNIVYFVERLNEALAHELSKYQNAFLFDFDKVISIFGKKYFCDDSVWQANHGSALEDSNAELDQLRLEKPESISRYFPLKIDQYRRIGWNELVAMYRTVLQVDVVKLVAVDLDDTIWRGVAADATQFSADNVEGWPLGLVEALGYLKRRGILLAALSKNEERHVAKVWEQIIYSRRLSLEDFAITKINWLPKTRNIQSILSATNLLPRNVVVIDDNPVERAAIKSAFPDIRVFGPNPYLWRRILLWSPETQVASITNESVKRSETIKSAVKRDVFGQKKSREEFLAELGINIRLSIVENVGDVAFARALELLNKTNQFNTTGKRWTQQQCFAAFEDDTTFCTFSVQDKFVNYGVVGVVVTREAVLQQFVMSCRVVGFDIERGVLAYVLRCMKGNGARHLTAEFVQNELNAVCRDFYSMCGFVEGELGLTRSSESRLDIPPHLNVSWESTSKRSKIVTSWRPTRRRNKPA
jgi:FkbH-like protein